MKKRHNFQRKKDARETKPAYLIITEDSKSSQCYLKGMIRHLEHNAKRFEINHSGSSPKSIMQKASVEINNYKTIFCVFDKDSHDNKGNTYTDLMNWIKDQKNVVAINSVPCFEYWLYLHFKYTDKPLENCEAIEKLLNRHIPKYNKGQVCFNDYEEGFEKAVAGGRKSINRFNKEDGEDPMTRMSEFYDALKSIEK